jgi:hypothetical protein
MVTNGVFPTRRANRFTLKSLLLTSLQRGCRSLPVLQFSGSLLVFERGLAVSIGLAHFEPRRIFAAQTGLGGLFQRVSACPSKIPRCFSKFDGEFYPKLLVLETLYIESDL